MSGRGLGALMPTSIGLAPDTREALRAMAEAEGVSPSALMRRILEETTQTTTHIK